MFAQRGMNLMTVSKVLLRTLCLRIVSACILILFTLISTFGCQDRLKNGPESGKNTRGGNSVRITHYYGNKTVTVPVVVKRIACGWPAQNSIIAMLGYGDKIVATSDTIKSVPLFRKFVPSIVNAVYCFSNSDVHMEELLKTKPDVLFVPDSMAGKVEQARMMGIAVATFRSNSLPAIIERTVITGEILGPDAHKKALAYQRYFNENVARVQRVVLKIPLEKRVRVYHSIRSSLTTAGGDSLVQDWMQRAGAKNVAEDWFRGLNTGTVTIEQILKADPDVIVAMNAESAHEMRKDSRWSNLRAVKNNKIYVNPRGMFWWCRETAEEALQILWLAKTIYPEYFRKIDMKKETKYFYKKFYGYDLTESEIQTILNPT